MQIKLKKNTKNENIYNTQGNTNRPLVQPRFQEDKERRGRVFFPLKLFAKRKSTFFFFCRLMVHFTAFYPGSICQCIPPVRCGMHVISRPPRASTLLQRSFFFPAAQIHSRLIRVNGWHRIMTLRLARDGLSAGCKFQRCAQADRKPCVAPPHECPLCIRILMEIRL